MNLNQLEILRALITTGSTIAAARVTGLSQSGVSRLLQQLESDLSMTLFLREKGRLIPTPEAILLAKDAQDVLMALERMSARAEDLRKGVSGQETVRVGLPISMWEHFAPAMLIDFTHHFPGVRIETFFETTTAIRRLVEHRVIDIGLLRLEENLGSGIVVDEVATGENVCVLPSDHPLTARSEVTPGDLVDVPLILIGRQRPNRLVLDQAFARNGVKPFVKIETHTNSSACSYVASGLGVAIISSFYANLFRELPIVQRPFRPRSIQKFGITRVGAVPLSIAALGLCEALKRQITRSQDQSRPRRAFASALDRPPPE
ncbi:LysR family transcriptional regulator [Rhizobium sp. LC145]|uniref:LysR family transcriptional regulator n=1 Tax=Rhizobium sp. LC145 TaxID=1120688 RepID=UPI000629F3C1|nr:LysR family transcriptional regulator [Rhizobium sp. LC145]KKX24866.1 LysR family transcriptional regulator [Rhizobium sp. LC145]TKT46755.1 LysR family transcriptional regulator [Rhizobiaceae bacterium LC148]